MVLSVLSHLPAKFVLY